MTKYLKGKGRFHPLSWAGILHTYKDLIPPFPDQTVVPTSKVPHPPSMHQSWTPARKAHHAAVWYRAALVHYYPHAKTFRNVRCAEDVLRDPAGPMLVEAIPHLEEHSLQVAPWVAFSVESWITYSGKKWPPQVKWVLSPNRMSVHAEWARWTENKWKGGQVIINEHHKVMLRSYAMMRAALLDAENLDRSTVKSIVAVFLPKQRYEGLKYLANIQATKETERLHQALGRGEWLWT